MASHNSTPSPNSDFSLPRSRPSDTASSFSNFSGSDSFRQLPTILQHYITSSSAPSLETSDGLPAFEDDSFNGSFELPSFTEVAGFRDSTTLPLTLDHFPPIQGFGDLVELSSDSDSPAMAPRRATKRAAESPSATSPTKRAKRDAVPEPDSSADKSIEELDLAEESTALVDTLKKQRQQQVASQDDLQKPTKLSKITCIICMDAPTDLTATLCGHVFCFECLTQALSFGDKSGGDGRRGNCPVCRKQISRVKKGDIIPLEIMKWGLAT